MKKKTLILLIFTFIFSLLLVSCNKSDPNKSMTFDLKEQVNINNDYDHYNAIDIDANVDFHRLFNDSIEHEIIIEITEQEWTGLLNDLEQYDDKFHSLKNSKYRKANFIYKDKFGTISLDEVGFRTRGNTSRVIPQNSDGSFNMSHFKIKFNETFHYQKETKKYDALNDREVFDLEELNIKWNRNYDSTYISELYSYELFHKVGIMSPESSLAKFSIKIGSETTYFGIYTIIEPIDKDFLTKRLGKEHNDGNLYKCLWQDLGQPLLTNDYDPEEIGIKDTSINYRPTYDLKTNKDVANHLALKDFIHNINTLDDIEFKKYINEHFEVDSFLRLLAMGVLIGNPDDYRGLGNNYYLYLKSNNKFEMIPYDYDHSLGQGWEGEPAFYDYTTNTNIYDWGEYDYPHPLSDRILGYTEYQEQFERYLSEFIDYKKNIFSYNDFFDNYLVHHNLYRDDIPNDLNNAPQFNSRNSLWYFNRKIKSVKEQLYYYKNNPDQRGGTLLGKD